MKCLSIGAIVMGCLAASATGQFTPSWTVGDWWEVEVSDVRPFCPAAHVCPPGGHPRQRTFLFVVVERVESEIEIQVVEGRDLTAEDSLLATFREEGLVRLEGRGNWALEASFPQGKPIPDPTGGGEVGPDFPAALFVMPAFPLREPGAVPPEEDVARTVEEMASDDWSVRAEAGRRLEGYGPAVVDRLAAFLDHPDPEVRYRVRALVDRLRVDPSNEEFQAVEQVDGVFTVRLAEGRTLVWRAGEPWWRELSLPALEVPGGAGPARGAKLVAKRGDAGVEPPEIAGFAAAQAYGEFLATEDREERRRLGEAFLTRFRDSEYASRVVVEQVERVEHPDAVLALLEQGRFLQGGPSEVLAEIEERLGRALADRGRGEEAAAAWVRAVEIAATNHRAAGPARRAMKGLARAAREGGDEKAALEWLARLVEAGERSDRIDALAEAAELHAAAGRLPEAEASLSQALAQAPPEAADEPLRFRLAEAVEAQGRIDEARRIFAGIRTKDSPWSERAREKDGGVRNGRFAILESSYPPGVGRSPSEVRPEGWTRAAFRALVSRVPGPVPEFDDERPFERQIELGTFRLVPPEKFNRGVSLLGMVGADLEADGAEEWILTALFAGYEDVKGQPTFYGGEVDVLSAGGTLRWKFEARPTSSAVAVQFDGDPGFELAVGVEDAGGKPHLAILKGGRETAIEVEGRVTCVEAAGPRMVVTTTREVAILGPGGEAIWREPVDGAVTRVVDFVLDGRPEVAIGDASGITLRDLDGNDLGRIDRLARVEDMALVAGEDGRPRLLVASAGLHVVTYDPSGDDR